MIIDFHLSAESLPLLLQGLVVTRNIAGAGCLIGLVLGCAASLRGTSSHIRPEVNLLWHVNVVRRTNVVSHTGQHQSSDPSA